MAINPVHKNPKARKHRKGNHSVKPLVKIHCQSCGHTFKRERKLVEDGNISRICIDCIVSA